MLYPKAKQKECGQVAIILALALVALLGMTALAVDVGILLADRREAQNTADAAALAGAGALARQADAGNFRLDNASCTSAQIRNALAAGQNAAIARAQDNGFTIDTDISDHNGVKAVCGTDSQYGVTFKYADVHVEITVETRSVFSQLIQNLPLKNSVAATARVSAGVPLVGGYSLASLDEDLDVGLEISGGGNGSINLINSGAYTNTGMVINGNVQLYTSIPSNYRTFLEINGGNAVVSPPPVKTSTVMSKPTVPPPDCSNLPDRGSHSGGGTIRPGRYTSISIHSSGQTLIMEPGLYCLSGDMALNGGSTIGHDVTIFLSSGSYQSSGNAYIDLRAPYNPVGGAIPGMLIFLGENNNSGAAIRGNTDSHYQGTIYSPQGPMEIGGNGSKLDMLHSQLIAQSIHIRGNVSLTIEYNMSENYTRKPVIDLIN